MQAVNLSNRDMVNKSNWLKGLPAAIGAAGTYAVTQTNWNVSVKDGIYIGLIFIATLFPGVKIPAKGPTPYSEPPK